MNVTKKTLGRMEVQQHMHTRTHTLSDKIAYLSRKRIWQYDECSGIIQNTSIREFPEEFPEEYARARKRTFENMQIINQSESVSSLR
jgi:hypothetical protein